MLKIDTYEHVQSASRVVLTHTSRCRNIKESVVQAGALVATLTPRRLSQSCPSSDPSDVCSQKSAVKKTLMSEEGGRRGERGSESVRGRVKARKGARRKSPHPTPFSRIQSLPSLTQLPLILQSPFLISFPFSLCLYSSPLIFSLSQTLIALNAFLGVACAHKV